MPQLPVPAAWGTFIQGTGKTWGRWGFKIDKLLVLKNRTESEENNLAKLAISIKHIFLFQSTFFDRPHLFVIFGRNSADIYTLQLHWAPALHRSQSLLTAQIPGRRDRTFQNRRESGDRRQEERAGLLLSYNRGLQKGLPAQGREGLRHQISVTLGLFYIYPHCLTLLSIKYILHLNLKYLESKLLGQLNIHFMRWHHYLV